MAWQKQFPTKPPQNKQKKPQKQHTQYKQKQHEID